MIEIMQVAKGIAAGGASLVLLVFAAPATASGPPAALLFDHALAPPTYTFHVDVAMAMRHFPWLHFHAQGDGLYEPGASYVVHFTTVPWFVPKAHHDADLSMLDPLMWPKRYIYAQIGQRNDQTLFELHAIGESALKSPTVAIGPRGKASEVDATYADGTHIASLVTSREVDGFFLPVSMAATIDEPHMSLSANADFTDYDFGPKAALHGPTQ